MVIPAFCVFLGQNLAVDGNKSLNGAGMDNHYLPQRVDVNLSNISICDANVTPSNLEATTVFGDLVDVKSDQFKG